MQIRAQDTWIRPHLSVTVRCGEGDVDLEQVAAVRRRSAGPAGAAGIRSADTTHQGLCAVSCVVCVSSVAESPRLDKSSSRFDTDFFRHWNANEV